MAARTRALSLLFASSGLAIGLALGCNAILGIEEESARPVPDDAAADVSTDVDARVATDKCTSDADCIAPNGCYTPRCDTVLGACTYSLCEAPGRACAAGKCDGTKCSEPSDYTFRAASYSVTDVALGCRTADACVTAAYPYVFLGTKSNVVALRVDDVLATAATKVPIEQVTVRPGQLVASGRRVWILGEPQGTAPPYQLPVAWIDVPSDPTLPALRGTSVLLSYPYPSATGFPAPNGELYLVHNEGTQGLPAARLAPPLETGASLAVANPADAGAPEPAPTLPMYRVSSPGGAIVAGSSGSRLVTYRGAGAVNLVAGAATPDAKLQTEATLTPAFAPLFGPRFTSGPDGVVAVGVPIVANPPGDCNCTTHERLNWIVPNAVGALETGQAVDFEGYLTPQVPGGICNQCNPTYVTAQPSLAWVDAKTLLTAAPASGATTFTAVRVVSRDPLAAPAKRRFVTTAADDPPGNWTTDRVALTSSNGFGYLVLADSVGNKVTLSVIDPRCDAK